MPPGWLKKRGSLRDVENVSTRKLSVRLKSDKARESAADQPQGVQQAPGDAVAARQLGVASDDEIRARPYAMYLGRGGHDGLDLDDWVRAERELRQRR